MEKCIAAVSDMSVTPAFILIKHMTLTSQCHASKYETKTILWQLVSQHRYSCVSALAWLYWNETSQHCLSTGTAVSQHLCSHSWLYGTRLYGKNYVFNLFLFIISPFQAGTTAAKGLLGIYFHVIKPKCIRLKPYTYKKCVKRSWFKCVKYVTVHSKKAHFYDLDKAV